jgi:UPF0755 protein
MKFFVNLLSFGFIFAVGGAIAFMALVWSVRAPGPVVLETDVAIERGTGLREIATFLKNENIIHHEYPFIIAAKTLNGGRPIQAGDYGINVRESISSIVQKMQDGDVIQRFITIPEGKTSYEIVKILNANNDMSGEIKTIPPEGSLLPETYAYRKNATRFEVIASMQDLMNKTFQNAWDNRADNLPFETMEEALILASIVEKETAVPNEYAKVAGVFVNRLRIDMPLQTDPTVIYGITLGKHQNKGKGPLGRRLLRKDIQADTPYNTYTRKGLTPTPISNPGKAAINAVMNPADHDYLYFVADGTGGHAFGKTLADHNRNVAKWRKIRK